MRNYASLRSIALSIVAGAMCSPAYASLLGRDIDGNPVDAYSTESVFLYDTDLDVTWLRNAGASSRATWHQVTTWVSALVVGSFDDWRLPSSYDIGTSNICRGYYCPQSELGHLWFSELGNSYGNPVNPGPFLNFKGVTHVSYPTYWTSTLAAPDASHVWVFNTSVGFQGTTIGSAGDWGFAVRGGDVAAPIPEPKTSVLLLLGVVALGGYTAMKRSASCTLRPRSAHRRDF